MSIEAVKRAREHAETRAANIAATLPDGDYYADGSDCVERISGARTACDTHWDACLVMMAANRRENAK